MNGVGWYGAIRGKIVRDKVSTEKLEQTGNAPARTRPTPVLKDT